MPINWGEVLKSVLPTGIAAGGSIIGSLLGGRAATQAAETEAAGIERAAEIESQLLKELYNLQTGLAWPRYRLGTESLGRLAIGMGSQLPQEAFATSERPPALPGVAGAPSGSDGSALGGAMQSAPGPRRTLGDVVRGGLSGAGLGTAAGLGIGALAGMGSALGPVGMLGGATIGAVSGLFGRGRREADQIVPYQNALTNEIAKWESYLQSKKDAGTLTQDDFLAAITTIEPLLSEFAAFTQKFGRAGPGARTGPESPLVWGGEALNLWKQGQLRTPQPRAHGGPIFGGQMYKVGERGPEILEMMPGSEGWVYPMRSADKMPIPGRQTGGPVSGGIPGDAWKPWGEMSESTRQWVMNQAAANPAQFSMMTNPDGGVRPMTPSEARSYAGWQQGALSSAPTTIAGGALDWKMPQFQPSADINKLSEQIKQWQSGAGAPASSVMPSPVAAVSRTEPTEQLGLSAYAPQIAALQWQPSTEVPEMTAPWQPQPAATSSGSVPVAPPASGPLDKNMISQWGWYDMGNGRWVHPETGATGRWTDSGLFINETTGQFFDPAAYGRGEQHIFSLPWGPSGSGTAPGNPYADMEAPYGPYPGEFLRPWQGQFGFDPSRFGYQPFNQPFQFTAEELMSDPSYQFRLDEGQKAIERSAAARGMLSSGRTLKELQRWAQGLASTEFQNAYDRALGRFNLGYRQAQDAYQRAWDEYMLAYTQFLANQQMRYQRLLDMAGV